jgi:uroporphyrinogen decarboxylase
VHPRVESLPRPEPDYHRFLRAVRRERPDRVPLVELAVHPQVVDALLGGQTSGVDDPDSRGEAGARRLVRLLHRLGYDVVKVSAPIRWNVERLRAQEDPVGENVHASPSGGRDWANEQGGPIGNRAELDRFRWPTIDDVDFKPLQAATAALADGMAIIGFVGGVLEFSMDLLGMQRFMIATRRDPSLVAAVIQRVGQVVYSVFEAYCRMESVCALWLGDDLGHKHGLLVSPALLEQHVVPWYRRFAQLAHRHGRPFLMHTCGKTDRIMPALVETDVDAKHSFEDAIEPVERFYDRWSDRIAVLGGVDVHLLSTADADSIRRRTLEILEHCAPHGGYAAGSGNSITDYIRPENYLAMVETVHAFNGRL